jgi:hypothetical protein
VVGVAKVVERRHSNTAAGVQMPFIEFLPKKMKLTLRVEAGLQFRAKIKTEMQLSFVRIQDLDGDGRSSEKDVLNTREGFE